MSPKCGKGKRKLTAGKIAGTFRVCAAKGPPSMPGITPHSSGLQVQRYVCRGCGEDCAVVVEAQSDAICACARWGAAPGTRRTPESEARGGGCRRLR